MTVSQDYADLQRRGMQRWVLARLDILDYVYMTPHSDVDMSPIGLERMYPSMCEGGCAV